MINFVMNLKRYLFINVHCVLRIVSHLHIQNAQKYENHIGMDTRQIALPLVYQCSSPHESKQILGMNL